ncbi:MAG: dTMP kinase [Dissulfurispiraceae bacterium]
METITKGLLIVIDGTDATGKKTQTDLLVARLSDAGYKVAVADFPQYGEKSAGLVEEYLSAKYGDAKEVGPYRASIFYAVDRYAASFKIRQWLDEGTVVVSNRYVAANMGHQGGKITDNEEREKYFAWLYDLEYGIFGIPKPDINIILHADPLTTQKMVDLKGHRDYIGGTKRDLHEADAQHLIDASNVYLQLLAQFPDFELIDCTSPIDGQMLSREVISERVWDKVMLKLSAVCVGA